MATPILLLSITGIISAVMLVIAAKVMYVPVDETAVTLREELPGANCGACGFAGCDDYAAALAGAPKSVAPNLCTPGGAGVAEAIAGILGVDAGNLVPQKAFVNCQGNVQNKTKLVKYEGMKTCVAAKQFYGGQWGCPHGCIGLGDCYRSCPYGAIEMVGNLPVIDHELCVGCGICVKDCPNNVISVMDFDTKIQVACNSTLAGKKIMTACKTACIGCKKCEKACEKFNAIVVENNLPKIDYDKCVGCGLCAKACPTGVIVVRKKQKSDSEAS